MTIEPLVRRATTRYDESVHDFTRLIVWKRAIDVAVTVYEVTARFPVVERFALSQQMRRAAASIPANIAEGSGRRTSAEFRQFLTNALGSATELSSHLTLASRLRLGSPADMEALEPQIPEIRRLLVALIKASEA